MPAWLGAEIRASGWPSTGVHNEVTTAVTLPHMRQYLKRILLDFAIETDDSESLSFNAGCTRDGDPGTKAAAAVFACGPRGIVRLLQSLWV